MVEIGTFVSKLRMVGKHQETVGEIANDDKEKALEMTIEELDLSVRSFNCLKRAS